MNFYHGNTSSRGGIGSSSLDVSVGKGLTTSPPLYSAHLLTEDFLWTVLRLQCKEELTYLCLRLGSVLGCAVWYELRGRQGES